MKTRTRAAALVIRENSILLVKHCKDGKEYYLLPGGGVEPGEFEEQAVVREMMEETGMEAKAGPLLFETVSIKPDRTRKIIQKVYLTEAFGEPEGSSDPRVIAAEFLPLSDLKSITLYPNLKEPILAAAALNFNIPFQKFDIIWEE